MNVKSLKYLYSLIQQTVLSFDNYKIDEDAFNDFKHLGEDFANEFQPYDEYIYIANKIYHLLIDNINESTTKPEHPFNRYADSKLSIEELCKRIRDDTYNSISNTEPFVRSIVRAFTSHGGLYREQLEELLRAYFRFVKKCIKK